MSEEMTRLDYYQQLSSDCQLRYKKLLLELYDLPMSDKTWRVKLNDAMWLKDTIEGAEENIAQLQHNKL